MPVVKTISPAMEIALPKLFPSKNTPSLKTSLADACLPSMEEVNYLRKYIIVCDKRAKEVITKWFSGANLIILKLLVPILFIFRLFGIIHRNMAIEHFLYVIIIKEVELIKLLKNRVKFK